MPEPGAASFERVFRAEHAGLVAFCFRRVSDYELARDITAEVFRIAWLRWSEPRKSDRAWLFGVARNLIGNEYTRRGGGQPLRLHEDTDSDIGADQRSDARFTAVDVQAALGGLPEAQQQLLRLTYWDGLSASEIAEVTGSTTPAVWARLTRARRAFAAAWQDQPPHTPVVATGDRS